MPSSSGCYRVTAASRRLFPVDDGYIGREKSCTVRMPLGISPRRHYALFPNRERDHGDRVLRKHSPDVRYVRFAAVLHHGRCVPATWIDPSCRSSSDCELFRCARISSTPAACTCSPGQRSGIAAGHKDAVGEIAVRLEPPVPGSCLRARVCPPLLHHSPESTRAPETVVKPSGACPPGIARPSGRVEAFSEPGRSITCFGPELRRGRLLG